MFYIDKINDKKILKSSMLSDFEPNLKHIFTTRESFVKTGEEKFQNAANSNREMILRHLEIENLFEIHQTHSTNIEICPKASDNREKQDASTFSATFKKEDIKPENPGIIDNTDGVILYKPNTATILNFADCTPVILYDPKNHITAGLHAGWRGTAGCIVKKGLKIMMENFNTKPENVIAAIAPCIHQEDFEAGMEVYEALKTTTENQNGLFKFKMNSGKENAENSPEKPFMESILAINTEAAKVYPDLALINARQLIEIGVKTIDISEFKTTKNNDILFSYRKNNKTTNRISMVLKLGERP